MQQVGFVLQGPVSLSQARKPITIYVLGHLRISCALGVAQLHASIAVCSHKLFACLR